LGAGKSAQCVRRGGNQVDGSPGFKYQKGGCTTVRRTMQEIFLKMSALMKVLGNVEVYRNSIKMWSEFEIEEFYRL